MTAHTLRGPIFVLPENLPPWLLPPRPPELPAREVKILTAGDALEPPEERERILDEDEQKRERKRKRDRERRREIAAAEIAAGKRTANASERAKKGAATKAARKAEERRKEREALWKGKTV